MRADEYAKLGLEMLRFPQDRVDGVLREDAADFRPAAARVLAAGARFAGLFLAGGVAGVAVVSSGASRFGRGVLFFGAGAGAAAAASAACRAASVTSVVTG